MSVLFDGFGYVCARNLGFLEYGGRDDRCQMHTTPVNQTEAHWAAVWARCEDFMGLVHTVFVWFPFTPDWVLSSLRFAHSDKTDRDPLFSTGLVNWHELQLEAREAV
ncbi:unnamed protein product [Protopolystoma xenopodis]|uniref:Uncharacterized protein n=1 Tax=Protopolystoma xenopodis TaxID=117903 RepID=A0A448WCC6_9PLAT|nr:unnamed protein product [Protopolystoma xenopodis]